METSSISTVSLIQTVKGASMIASGGTDITAGPATAGACDPGHGPILNAFTKN